MKKTKITAAIMIALAGSVMVTSAESAEVKAGFHHGHEWREPPRREWHEPPPPPPPPGRITGTDRITSCRDRLRHRLHRLHRLITMSREE